jgi:serine/threonine protein kinase
MDSELPSHPNVVHLFGVSLDGPQPIIVLEYCAGGTNEYSRQFIVPAIHCKHSPIE